MAYAVQQSPAKRDLWRAFLVSGATFKQIADWLRERSEVVYLFSLLFWNVFPWLNDGAHMTNLLSLNELEARDSGIALAQLAYQEGPLRLAQTVGLRQVALAPDVAKLYHRLERGLLVRANAVIDRRTFARHLQPSLRVGETLLLERKKSATKEVDDDMRRGLGGMSLAMAVNEDVQKIFEGDVNRRVALQLGLAVEQAKEAQTKNATQTKQSSEGKSPA
jgi:hypothetical protein